MNSRPRPQGCARVGRLRLERKRVDASVHPTDLIALATRGRGGLKRLVLGSVADKVLRGANVAVMVYRPGDEAVAAQH